jgi:hypothetical protein
MGSLERRIEDLEKLYSAAGGSSGDELLRTSA